MIDIALQLFGQGYIPLRLEPGEKYTKAAGWSTDVPTDTKLHRAFARPSNLGIRLGDDLGDGTHLIAIDIDIEEVSLIRCVEKAIGEKVPVKRGKKGYTYFVRMDRETRTHKIQWYRNDKKIAAIDVLAKGAQTVLPPSIHPETQLPYTWVAGTPLTEVNVKTLPVYGPALLDEIRGFCKNPDDFIHALNDMEWRGVGGGGNTHDACVQAVSSMVARHWTDEDIQARIQRAKRDACDAAGMPYDWPNADRAIQEWIDSARDKKFDTTTKKRVDDIPAEMFDRYAYVVEIDRMYDLKKSAILNKTQFDNVHGRDWPKPWSSILVSPDLRIVDKLTYAPGQPRFSREKSFDSEAILDCINVWVPSDVEPEEGDISPWTQLVHDVFDGDKAAIDHVISFLAYSVQFPGERINHALVIQGAQGIGKDSILFAMAKVLGHHNMAQVTLQNVESQFNEWLFGKQLIVFQEMLAPGRRSVYNKLKTFITDPIHTINAKHLSLQRVPNRANYVFLTNYEHALSIDPSDRRMWVWYSKMTPKSKEYYTRFYRWMADKRSSDYLLQFLLNYDTSKFHPTAAPPMTESKRSMIRSSSSEIEQFLREATESGSWPMTYDLVSPMHLMSAIRPIMRSISTAMVHEALDHIAGKESECRVKPRIKGDGKHEQRIRLRAIRNHSKWIDADAHLLLKEYKMPLPPQTGETEGGYSSLIAHEDEGKGGDGVPAY
jgi:hypothetical protein